MPTWEEIVTMPAGRELDCLVAQHVLGQDGYYPGRYSTELALAWDVLKRACERYGRCDRFLDALARQARTPEGYQPVGLWALAALRDRFPAAVCRAALLATIDEPTPTPEENVHA
jgi:hypothetical protein